MKRLKYILSAAFLFFIIAGVPVYIAASQQHGENSAETKRVDIMFTHDTHSHLDSFLTQEDGENVIVGGFARIKTLIDEKKAENANLFLFDAGDFSMGTLVQTIFMEEAAELRMLGALGCDVTTFGNHEFDYRSQGLADMLENAASNTDRIPALALCNVDWESMEKDGLTDEQQVLKKAFEVYGVSDYIVVQKGNVKIAVIGVFGEDSLKCAPTCVLKFKNAPEAVRKTIEAIRANENSIDMIVCVSHSGTNKDIKRSEDEILAKEVPELDLIISGHTHTVLNEPIVYGDTYIVSCGSYGRYLGSLSMRQNSDGRWSMEQYELLSVTEEIAQDKQTQDKIDGFMDKVDTQYLSGFGYERKQVLAENDVTFCSVSDLSKRHQEGNLGNIIADSYVYAVEHAQNFDGIPVDFAVAPSGTVRGTYPLGNITVEDVFNSFSLGIGADGVPGYPLVSVYLTGRELKTVAEIDASVSDIMTTARLYISGMNFSFNPNRLILNKVTDCYLVGDNGERIEIDDDKLYRIVSDLYSGQMLSAATDVSYGLLSIVPKNADGVPYENIEDAIIMDGNMEMKAWSAIASYMESFPDTDGSGVGNVPEAYGVFQGRKVVENSKNIIDLIKNPNRYAFMIMGIVLVIIIIIVLIILFIVKLLRRTILKRRRLT